MLVCLLPPQKSALFDRRARPGLDYEPVTGGDVILNDGATFGLLPVTIMADDVPELSELFNIRLLRLVQGRDTIRCKVYNTE